MRTGRLEAFSDGVIAIIITIMVLEMKVPHGDSPNDLLPVLPIFLSYVLSFVYVGTVIEGPSISVGGTQTYCEIATVRLGAQQN